MLLAKNLKRIWGSKNEIFKKLNVGILISLRDFLSLKFWKSQERWVWPPYPRFLIKKESVYDICIFYEFTLCLLEMVIMIYTENIVKKADAHWVKI